MKSRSTTLVGFCLFLALIVVIHRFTNNSKSIPPKPVQALPMEMDSWSGSEDQRAWRRLKERAAVTPEKQIDGRMAQWRANFPYKEILHPTLRFDPSLYDPNDSSTWRGMNRRRFQPVLKAHGYLKGFFENERRFSRGFEQLYRILEEHDRHDNPIVVAGVFQILGDYHEAATHPADEIIMKKEFTGQFDEFGQHITIRVPVKYYDGKGELLPPKTWGKKATDLAESIVYKVHARKLWPEKDWMPEAQAMALRDRIISEIDPADIPGGRVCAYSHSHELALQPGDPFLIPNEGWVEALWRYQDEVVAPLMQRRAEEAIRQRNEMFQVDGVPTFHPASGQ